MKWKIRKPKQSDLDFILNSWLMSNRNTISYRHVPNDLYFKYYGDFIKNKLITGNILIACDKADENQIFGYISFSNLGNIFVCDYIYIKHSFRRLGIAKDLIATAYPNFTKEEFMATSLNELIMRNKDKYKIVYNPFFKELSNESFVS